MSKKAWTTAGELMAELNANPEFVRRRDEKEKKRRQREEAFIAMEKPVLDQLRLANFEAISIQDAINRYAPLPPVMVVALLDCVKGTSEVMLLEWLIRALAAAGQPFDGRPLIECYETVCDENIRWVILNTIALTKPHSIDDWMAKAIKSPNVAKTLHSLGYGNQG